MRGAPRRDAPTPVRREGMSAKQKKQRMTRRKARSEAATEFARDQRRGANEFAWTVWQWLRNRQCHGQKFRREVPIGPYTADFCCLELKLIIEIDGEPHLTEEGRERDRKRDAYMKKQGYKILRVPGYEVIREDGGAHDQLWDFVKAALDALGLADG